MTGKELRAERLAVDVQGQEIAICFGRHPAAITRLEQRDYVDSTTVERYRAAIVLVLRQRREAEREATRALADEQIEAWTRVRAEVSA